jgi:DNA-binding NtrC family response regulator
MRTRVLIVDADNYLLAAYKKHLASEGFEVATAQDGLECLRRLRESGPDVLVLDPTIPWGGGDGVVSLLHEAPDLPRVRIILLLTYGCSPAVLYNIARFHIADYRMKPMDGRRLVQWIRSVLAECEADRSEARFVEGGVG